MLTIVVAIERESLSILSGPDIITRGFVYVKDSAELIDAIKEMCETIINENVHDNYVDYTKIKTTIRDNLSKYLSNQTGNKPMIISVLQEI